MKKILSAVLVICIVFTPMFAFLSVHSQEPLNAPLIELDFEDNFSDASGNSHNGTKAGNVTFTQGIIGKGIELQGGYVTLENTKDLSFLNGLTLSVWIKLNPEDYKINWPILYKEGSEDGWPAMLYQIGYGGTAFSSSVGFGEDYYNYTFDFYSNNPLESAQLVEKWAHIAVVLNGEEEKVYIDGELSEAQYIPDEILEYTNEITQSSRPLQLGKSGEDQFKGYMDELKIFDYALNDDEVYALYDEANAQYNGQIELKVEDPYIYINGEKKQIDPQNIDTVPVVVEDRTLVPIRAIVDAIGGTIGWDGNEKRVDISYKSKTLQLWLNNKNAKVNGQGVQLDVPPMSINERTMLPLRFVSENLGMKVEWNASTRSIILKYIK